MVGMRIDCPRDYAVGSFVREAYPAAAIQEMYEAEVSPTIILQVTEGVYEQVITWQDRLLKTLYPIVYLDCIVMKFR